MAGAETIDDIIDIGKEQANRKSDPPMIMDDDEDTEREPYNARHGQLEGQIDAASIDSHPTSYQIRMLHFSLTSLFFVIVVLQSVFVPTSPDPLTAQVMTMVFGTIPWLFAQYQWNSVVEEIVILNISTRGIKAARVRNSSLTVAGALLNSILVLMLTASAAFVRSNQVVTWIFVIANVAMGIVILCAAFFVEKCKRSLILPTW